MRCELATGVKGNLDPGTGASIYAPFPYDAALLYDFRLANALNAKDTTEEDNRVLKGLVDALRGIRDQPNKNGGTVGAPVPYAAILKADGDRMGKLLAKAKSANDSRSISQALHGFASAVRGIVREYRGHAVYSGGDDVLALLPLDQAVPCAHRLAESFAERMAGIANQLDLEKKDWPSLSVGLGIGHLMEPLGSLRARADRAETVAKGNGLSVDAQRNALSIQLGIRSGAEYSWRAQWADAEAFAHLDRFKRAFQQAELSSRVPYDLREIARRLGRLDDWTEESGSPDQARAETVKGIRRSEVARMLERAGTEGGNKPILPDLYDLIRRSAAEQSLNVLADTLIIARWLSARTAADLGDPT